MAASFALDAIPEQTWGPPSDEEKELYGVLTSEDGLCVTVDDPVFDDIWAYLRVERFFRATLVLDFRVHFDCADDKQSFAKSLSKLSVRTNDSSRGGCGLTFTPDERHDKNTTIVSPSHTIRPSEHDLATIILHGDTPGEDRETRDTLYQIFLRLREDPQAYDSSALLFGCLPGGCFGCITRRRRRDSRSEDDPTKSVSFAADADMSHSKSFAPDFGRIGSMSPDRGKKPGRNSLKFFAGKHKTSNNLGLDDAKAKAKKLWAEYGRPDAIEVPRRGRSAFLRRSGTKDRADKDKVDKEKSDVANDADETGSVDMASSPESSAFCKDGLPLLDAATCTSLLLRMLCREEDGLRGLACAPDGPKLFQPNEISEQGAENLKTIEFEEFWNVCESMTLAAKLDSEPVLQQYLERHSAGPVINATNLSWFVVQVQTQFTSKTKHKQVGLDKKGDGKSNAGEQETITSMLNLAEPPEVDSSGRMTLYGLSKFLCSENNSILDPSRRSLREEDLKYQIKDYWIASAHHLHSDSSVRSATTPSIRISRTSRTSENSANEEENSPVPCITAALRNGCRSISLVLVSGSGRKARESEDDDAIHVILQQGYDSSAERAHSQQKQRVLFSDVLIVIHDFITKERDGLLPLPLILVLTLSSLSLKDAAEVPNVLEEGLADVLWPNVGTKLPSPADARGKVIIVLAPTSAASDWATSDLSVKLPPPTLLGKVKELARASTKQFETLEMTDDPDPSALWQEAAKKNAVWAGYTFDDSFPQRSPQDVSVGFLSSDVLQALEVAKAQQLIEYHRQYLGLAYAMTSRSAPTNFNPACAWSHGIQMVPMMLNGAGKSALLAHAGRFAQDNDGCGYILKPQILRERDEESGDEAEPMSTSNRAEASEVLTLKIRILHARAAVPSSQDSQISIAVSTWGESQDCKREAYSPVRAYGGHVVTWPESEIDSMTFAINSANTAILMFELSELVFPHGRASTLGVFALPVSGVRSGIRWVPLWKPGSLKAEPTSFGPLCGLLVYVWMERKIKKVKESSRKRGQRGEAADFPDMF